MIERIKNQSTLQLKEEEWALIDQSLALEKSLLMTEQLSREFAFTFPKDEIGYLALHIASLQMDRKISHLDSKKRIENPVAEIIQLLVENVSDIMGIDLSKDPILKRNLQSHLESAYLRVMSQFHISNPLLKEIKTTYTHLFLVIQMILEDYAEREGILFPEEEMAYLTVHFKAAFERVKEERNYRAIITCNYGIGVSSFLEAKIQHALPNINIVALLNEEELKDYENNEDIDFVITTTERADISVPQIKVSPLMERKDMEKLKEFIKASQPKEKLVSFDFEEYTNSFLIQPQIDFKTKEACLSFMCEQMEQKGYIGPHYKNSVFQREESSSTQIAPLVAIPHGNPKHVIKSGIFIATLKEAVDWGNGKVQLVLLLALHKEDLGLKETKNIFSSLYQLTANKKRLARLFDQKNQLGILKVLSENHSTDSII
ncbi:MAG: PRD domain-containing protein [Atopostipes suicloacalis]|nr:PRD domain-containing protein [Atopostipes suicloacalis]